MKNNNRRDANHGKVLFIYIYYYAILYFFYFSSKDSADDMSRRFERREGRYSSSDSLDDYGKFTASVSGEGAAKLRLMTGRGC